MAKLRNPLLSLNARNTLGKVITFARRRRQNIVEKKPVPPDAKTLAQLSWRHMYLKAVALWHALSAAEKQDWESQARSRHMTGFAWFMSQALKPNPGLYLPLQGGTMTGDIDMAKNRLLRLPLPTDAQEGASKTYVDTLIAASLYTEGARVWHNGHQNIPNNTATVLAFDSELYDTDNIHDPAVFNSRLTCKTAGKYVIIGQVSWDINAVNTRQVYIFLNEATTIGMTRHGAAPTIRTMQEVATFWDLGVGDFVELKVLQDSGGALLCQLFIAYSPVFGMHRIG